MFNNTFHPRKVLPLITSCGFIPRTVYEFVEKRKIWYFRLALYLFQHLISPNQDDLSYSARTFISGLQNGGAAKTTLFGLRRRPEQTFFYVAAAGVAMLKSIAK